MVELLKKSALNRFSKQRAESRRWVPVLGKGWGCGRCGEVQRGFLSFWCHLLAQALRKVRGSGDWSTDGRDGVAGVPSGAGAVFPPCRAHRHSWCCTPPRIQLCFPHD